MTVYGTRPEAIKVAPVIQALQRSEHLDPVVVVTGQHRQMLDQVNALFGITPDHDLDIISARQSLEDITTRTLTGLAPLLEREKPDLILVQGDTTTCFAAALSAFYHKVPVAHLEAGLRTDNPYNPFPEEVNRRLTTQLASLHFAPTATSRANLLASGVTEQAISTTGNSVIDALLDVVGREMPFTTPELKRMHGQRCVLVTSHRRESWGEPMRNSGTAIRRLAQRFGDVLFVLPIHLNPVVREALLPLLSNLPNVLITEPLDYADFARCMSECHIVLTDSGGVQEEAPSLGKPVLVMRETTERPEAIAAGTVRLVGTDAKTIVEAVAELLTSEAAYGRMARAVNPYGDGRAAARCVTAMEHYFGYAARPAGFKPAEEIASLVEPGSA